MTTLLLIRHGQSSTNAGKMFTGQLNVPLTDTGRVQAAKAAAYLQENWDIDCIYASDLCRARDTAAYLGQRLGREVYCLPGLREVDAGRWTGRPLAQISREEPEAFSLWQQDIGRAVCPGGESVEALSRRVKEALEQIASQNSGKTAAVFTHATPIQAMQSLLRYGSLENMKQFSSVGNATVTVLHRSSSGWTFGAVGMDDHL